MQTPRSCRLRRRELCKSTTRPLVRKRPMLRLRELARWSINSTYQILPIPGQSVIPDGLGDRPKFRRVPRGFRAKDAVYELLRVDLVEVSRVEPGLVSSSVSELLEFWSQVSTPCHEKLIGDTVDPRSPSEGITADDYSESGYASKAPGRLAIGMYWHVRTLSS